MMIKAPDEMMFDHLRQLWLSIAQPSESLATHYGFHMSRNKYTHASWLCFILNPFTMIIHDRIRHKILISHGNHPGIQSWVTRVWVSTTMVAIIL